MKSALFSPFGENWGQCDDFDNFDAHKCDFRQNVLRMTGKERFVQFSWKAHCFKVLARTLGQCDDFENFDMLKNAIWPKRFPHDLKGAFSTIFMESALFFRFEDDFRPVWPFWKYWRSKMRFGQNVLSMTWKERFVQFLWKAHCFPVLKIISGQCDDFDIFDAHKCDFRQHVLRMTWKERFVQFSWKAHCFKVLARTLGQCDDFKNFDAQKCDLAKTCFPWSEKSVLYNFQWKRTVFPF